MEFQAQDQEVNCAIVGQRKSVNNKDMRIKKKHILCEQLKVKDNTKRLKDVIISLGKITSNTI